MGRPIEHFTFDDPVGGHVGKASATYKVGRDGRRQWFIGCFGCPPDGYLRALADEVGAPSGAHIKDDPLRWLGPLVGPPRPKGRPAPLPTPRAVDRWRRCLGRSPAAMRWLVRRGLEENTISGAQLGYDGRAVTIPVLNDRGRIVNLRRRYLDGSEPKYRGLRGRGVQLYPGIPRGRSVLLCEGEFDALLARQHGLPAVTPTCGKSLPPHLVEQLRGRRVYVAYDRGAEAEAERTAAKLGPRARVVALPHEAPEGYDLTDWFGEGRTADELRALAAGRGRRAA